MAQRGRRFFCQADLPAVATRRLSFAPRSAVRDQPLPRRTQPRPKTLCLDRRPRPHHRRRKPRVPSVRFEPLAGQAADALALAESAVSARRDTVSQTEVLARAVRDASPQIETLGQAAAFVDAFLAIEAGCELDIANISTCENLISAADTSFAMLDSRITPIIQIAAGRLLKSLGKIRILNIWKQ